MQMFVRTLHQSTAVSSACSVGLNGDRSGERFPWMLVCRPTGCVELWCEADGQLAPRGGVEVGEAVHLIALPRQLPTFLAVEANDRVTIVTLQKGDTEDAVPFVRECGSLDLEADSLQQAARRGVGGAVCSQAIHLHDVAGLEFLDSMLQDGNVTAALDPAQMPQAAAAEAAALQAASDMPASSLRSHVLSDGDDAGSEEDAAAPGHRGPLAAGASRDAPAAQAGDSAALPAAPEQPPMAARFVTVLCVRQGWLHFVGLFAGANQMGQAGLAMHVAQIPPLPDSNLGGSDGRNDEVLAMRLLRRKKKGSHIVVDLVLLCGATGKHSRQLAAWARAKNGRPERYLRLARMRFDSLAPAVGPIINWRAEAPFYNRMVEPTASLLQCADDCLLTISQHQVLVHTRGLMGDLACNLPAPPVAAVEALPNLYVIADASGGLSVLDASGGQHSWRCRPIKCGSQLSVATALCFVLCTRASEADHAGWLFLGSHTGDSQLLAAPRLLAEELAAGQPISDAALQWQVLEPHTIDSLAPIQDQLTFENPAGSGEQRLALCCGTAPSGSLRIADMGVSLHADAQVDLGLQGRPSLWAVHRSPGDRPPYLVLSSELAGATSLLKIRGMEVEPTRPISGLRLDEASLLVANAPDYIMLQVTAQHVWTMPVPHAVGFCEHWAPPEGSGPITVAASHGHHVLVACSNDLHYLEILPPSDMSEELRGNIRHVFSATAPEQVAALGVLEMRPGLAADSSGAGCVYALIGTWVSNEVLLMPLQQPDGTEGGPHKSAPAAPQVPLLRLPHGTPRSLLVQQLDPGGAHILFVGSSSGKVVYCSLQGGSDPGSISLGEGRVVQAGLAEVRLVSVPAGVLAVSDQILLLRHNPNFDTEYARPEWLTGTVDAQRVHHTDGVAAATGLGSQAVPNGLVWLTEDGKLTLGEVDPEVRLRWRTAHLGNTPLHIGLLPSSSTLLVATESADKIAWLRLFHTTALQQLVEVKLREGQQHTALHAGRVPLPPSAASSATQNPAAEAVDLAVVGHYQCASLLEQASAAGGGRAAQQLSARLSFFTVQRQPSEDAAKDRYQLQLLGSHPVPSVCHAVTLLQPGSNSGDTCQLVAACHSGVQVYRLHISPSTKSDGSHYSISLERMSQLDGCLGCVTMLRPVGGGDLAAGPLLGSLIVCGPDTSTSKAPASRTSARGSGTAGAAQPAESRRMQRLRLRPRSADIGSLYAMDFLPLAGDRFLVAAHPSGVVVMRRFRELEVEAEAEAAKHRQRAAEAGRWRRGADGDNDGPGALPEAQPNLVPLGVQGGCRTQHNIVGLLPGRLGVPHAPLPPSCCLQPIDVSNISSCGSESRERVPKGEDKRRECALFTSRDGAVGIIQAISPGEYSLLLEAQLLARRAHISRHDCTGGRGHEAVWTLHGYDPEEEEMAALPETIIDGDLLATALEAPAERHPFLGDIHSNGTADLVYELSLGTFYTRWQ